jgi:hypothetical protein
MAELGQQPLRFLLRQPSSNHRLRNLLLCLPVEFMAFGKGAAEITTIYEYALKSPPPTPG